MCTLSRVDIIPLDDNINIHNVKPSVTRVEISGHRPWTEGLHGRSLVVWWTPTPRSPIPAWRLPRLRLSRGKINSGPSPRTAHRDACAERQILTSAADHLCETVSTHTAFHTCATAAAAAAACARSLCHLLFLRAPFCECKVQPTVHVTKRAQSAAAARASLPR